MVGGSCLTASALRYRSGIAAVKRSSFSQQNTAILAPAETRISNQDTTLIPGRCPNLIPRFISHRPLSLYNASVIASLRRTIVMSTPLFRPVCTSLFAALFLVTCAGAAVAQHEG